MIEKEEYSTRHTGFEEYSFFWLKLATAGILLYYVSEMISRIFYFFLDYSDPEVYESVFKPWMIADSAFYSLSFMMIAVQVLSWRNSTKDYETRRKARSAFFVLLLAAALTTLYDVLTVLQEELNYSERSDNTAAFLFMIIAHFYGIYLVKQLIVTIGRSKNTNAGDSIFYTLFGLNPAIRYLLWFIFLVFSLEYTVIFTYYSSLIMVYLTSAVTVGFTYIVIRDSRRIRVGHLLSTAKAEKEEEKKPEDFIADQDLFVKAEKAIFCQSCGVRVDNGINKCPKCGKIVAA